MRCSGWSSLAISVCSALLLTGAAAAHVVATPGFLASGSSESISLATPNERDEPTTAFALTAPPGLEIENAHPVEGWVEQLDGPTATWTGGSVPSGEEVAFGVTLKANVDPGVLELQAEQRYADGRVVRWPVAVTITPATERNLALAGVVGLLGVLVVIAIGMLAWRRRDAARRNP